MARAQNAWDELRARFPDAVVSRAVEKQRALVHAPQDVWKFCNALRAERANWKPETFSWFFANETGKRVLDWRGECETRLLLPLQRLTRDALDTQLKTLGLQWQVLSDEFDLNRDGVRDPIRIIETEESQEAWTFLSDGAAFRPLYAAQPYPLDAIDLDAVTEHAEWRGDTLVVTDLDRDELPEIVYESQDLFWLWRWNGERFERVASDGTEQGLVRRVPFTLATAADGAREIVTELETPTGVLQRQVVYRLQNGELENRTLPQHNAQFLSDTLGELFWHQQPRRAVERLAQTASYPAEPPLPLYLRALAYEYDNQADRARAEFSALRQQFPDSAWALQAETHLSK
ncbi:MAG: hypothetical protein HY741_07395 [Chloroflexi bacterium]|nr:hypothetical protein [Chloroflexota bacterium]